MHRLAWNQVRGLETYAGRRSNTMKGAVVGAGIGAGLGLLAGLAADTDGMIVTDRGEAVAIGVTMGALNGLLLGAIIGAVARTDRWESVGVPRAAVAVTGVRPPAGGAGLAVVLRR